MEKIRHIFPDLPSFAVMRSLNAKDLKTISGQKVIAFAGIGDPEGFFDMLGSAGINLAAKRTFPDHHLFHDNEIDALAAMADDQRAILVTTEKDMMRIP
ncbi:MAG: hypothetical protein EBZ29_13640, partial [Synechococcaceae bacterium WB9_4xC_028]|nr:hypothetical protein [Synechococcaceae bacterium WB9_4xC_028]